MRRRALAARVTTLVTTMVLLGACGGDGDAASLTGEDRETVLRVSASSVERLLSYDASTMTADVSEIADLTTGDLTKEYEELLVAQAGGAIRAKGAVSAAKVLFAGTVDESDERPVVLVFVRQSTTAIGTPAPRLNFAALEVALLKDGDGWQIASLIKVEPVRRERKEEADD